MQLFSCAKCMFSTCVHIHRMYKVLMNFLANLRYTTKRIPILANKYTVT